MSLGEKELSYYLTRQIPQFRFFLSLRGGTCWQVDNPKKNPVIARGGMTKQSQDWDNIHGIAPPHLRQLVEAELTIIKSLFM
ncbi:MAG: hypothetical protein GWO87_00705 [Xanthomonadaceae bacterium]|nr:hypothetical protein [Rhodospirillaceae bacterium]NIA17698.1 hypothetical protein [Xanthomonadaceae bacterium]